LFKKHLEKAVEQTELVVTIMGCLLDRIMNLVLNRPSLVSEATAALRKTLKSDLWTDYLPGERVLSLQLHVSRQTLRAALKQLLREGLVQVEPGRRRRIVRDSGSSSARTPSKVVCMLSPLPLHSLRPFDIFLVDNIREHLAEEGFHLELHVSYRYYSKHPFKALESLVHQKPIAAYILFLATLQMQRWFLDRGLPVCVAGSSYPEIQLPAVDVDHRAVCRHAVGTFFSKGCRQIVLLIEEIRRAGDEESRNGFLEAAKQLPGGRQALIAEHNGTAGGICARLDTLLGTANPPDAFLVANSAHVLTVIGHLLRKRMRLPGQVHLISRDDDSFLKYVVPTVARYRAPPGLFARKLSRIVVQLARGTNVAPRNTLLIPQLIRGETMG
jgi:LacI family transcriptional regulator